MYLNNNILVGKNDKKELSILLNKANRHGIITGASGTGKTITLKVMAESFSDAGVPVFLADVKGDLAGTCLKGVPSESIDNRVQKLKLTELSINIDSLSINLVRILSLSVKLKFNFIYISF